MTERDTRPPVEFWMSIHPSLLENSDRGSLIQILGQEVLNEAQRRLDAERVLGLRST